MNLFTQAKTFAETITGLPGVTSTVTHDPAVAASAGGTRSVLVVPPTVDLTTRTTEWTLVATIGQAPWNVDTLEQLAAIVEELTATTLPIESATPGSYPLINTQPPVPAYVLRLTATP